MKTNITPEQLFQLTKECLNEYPIDLTDEPVSTDDYLKLACYSVIEQFQKLDYEEAEIAYITSITTLALENFLLTLKMIKMVNKNGNAD